MHVGFVTYDGLDGVSGGYRYDRKLVAHLERSGDTVEVIALSRPGDGSRGRREAFSRLNRPFDLLIQDELCRPSLVAQNRELTEPTAVVALVHLLDSAVPGAGSTNSDERRRERRYLETVDGALCTSRDTQRRVSDIAALPTAVAYPSGRQEGAVSSADAVTARAGDDPFEICFLGAVTERKGVSTLVEALADLGGRWRATVVGPLDGQPGYVRDVRAACEERGIDDRFSFRGEVPASELEAVFARSHVLALPSTYEPFGMAALEAMEHGVVPVATRRGGPPEFIETGVSGTLVEPDDATALRDALAALKSDRGRLAALAAGALAAAEGHPTWAESMARVRGFLRERVECAQESGGTSDVSESASSVQREGDRA